MLFSYALSECTGENKVFEKKDLFKSSKIGHFTRKKFFSVRKKKWENTFFQFCSNNVDVIKYGFYTKFYAN